MAVETTTPRPLGRTAPRIYVANQELSDANLDALISARVELALCLPGRVTLRFRDQGHKIAKSSLFRLNTSVQVKIESTSVISAYVTAVHASRNQGDQPEYVVTADDKAFKLTRGIAPKAYLMTSFADTISQIASSAGLSASVSTHAGMNQPQQQYQLVTGTGMSYLNALCRRVGAVWWVDGTMLHVSAPSESSGSVSKNVNEDMLDFSVRASGLHPTATQVDGWDPLKKEKVTGTASTPTTRGTPPSLVSSYLGQVSSLTAAKSSFGTYNPVDTKEAGEIAAALLDEAADSAVIARGTCFADPAFKPAAKLTMTSSSVFTGDYFLSEVEHTYTRNGFFTRFVAGPHRPTSLVETLGRRDEDPGINMSGLVIGKVTNNHEPEGFDLGRVQVEYVAQPGNPVSAWARVAAAGAGSNRGFMFHPEVGDEVLLGFEHNDLRRPIVLGGVWGGAVKADPSTVTDANKKVKARQIASVQGNVLEFGDDDAETGKHIKLALAGGQTLRLGADKVTLDTSQKPLEITVGQAKLTIDANGNVAIEGMKVGIKATQDLTLEGTNVSVKANAKITLEANAAAEIKAKGQVSVESSGITQLKGSMVKIN